MRRASGNLRRRWRTVLQFWFAHIALPIATTVIGIAGLVAIVNLAPSRPDPANPGQTQYYGWGPAALIIAVPLFVLGLVSLIVRLQSGESRAERIKRLTMALEESMKIIAEINSEMAEGEERLADLERQTAVQAVLARLTSRESAAVREALKAELSLERRRSLKRDVAMMLVGVVLGAVLSYILVRFF